MLQKSSPLLLLLFAVCLLNACGPAAEDRATMVSRAKEVQDSIANSIRTAMQEAESPAPAVVTPPATLVSPGSTAVPAQAQNPGAQPNH